MTEPSAWDITEYESEDDGHRSICTVSTLGLNSVVGNSGSCKPQDRSAVAKELAAVSKEYAAAPTTNRSTAGSGISISSLSTRRSLTKRSTVASLDDSLHSSDDEEEDNVNYVDNIRNREIVGVSRNKKCDRFQPHMTHQKTTLNVNIKYVGRTGDILIPPASTTNTNTSKNNASSLNGAGDAGVVRKQKSVSNGNIDDGHQHPTNNKNPRLANKNIVEEEAPAAVVNQCRVRFREVEVRAYNRVIGDNPSVSTGPAISLGWKYTVADRVTINDYERTRNSTGKQVRPIRRIDREEMLRDLGFTRFEIADSVRGIIRTKNQRRQTYHNLKLARMEESVESAVKTVKKVFRARSAARRELEILNYGSCASSESSSLAVGNTGPTHVIKKSVSSSRSTATTSSQPKQHDKADQMQQNSTADVASRCSSSSSCSRSKSRVLSSLMRRRSSKDKDEDGKPKLPIPKSSNHSSSTSGGSRRSFFRSQSKNKEVIEYELDRHMPVQKQSTRGIMDTTGTIAVAKSMVVLARSTATVVCEEPLDDDDVAVAGASDNTLPTCSGSLVA